VPQQWTVSSSPVAAAELGMNTAAVVAAAVAEVDASAGYDADAAGSAWVDVHLPATSAVLGLRY
jgi:hypothetical protein